MKILKLGKVPEPKSYIFKCYNCNTEFEASEYEVHRRTGYLGSVYYVFCPLCKLSIKVNI